jgi:alpha-1,3-rhamnosyl/mannosyltransferase
MRVLVNQLSALSQRTGIGHYTSQLLRCLQANAGMDVVDAFPNQWLWQAYRPYGAAIDYARRLQRIRGRVSTTAAIAALAALPRFALWQLNRVTSAAKRRYFDYVFSSDYYHLYHEPNYIPLSTVIPTIVTLHDLSVLLHPEWHPSERVKDFEKRFYVQLHHCCHFLTDSDSIRSEVIRLLGIPAARVTRVYLGVRPHMVPMAQEEVVRQLARLDIQPNYILYLGTVEPRKNLLMLMRTYCSLPRHLRERCPLLLVGKWGWRSATLASYYYEEARHLGVRHVDYVDDRCLPALYNGARAMAFPSFYEGFGLPPVEMLACGGAVLASTAEVLKETVGGQAQLIDPDDGEAWRAALARVIEDDDFRDSLRAGAVGAARRFTWEACAAETMRVYRLVAGESGLPTHEVYDPRLAKAHVNDPLDTAA